MFCNFRHGFDCLTGKIRFLSGTGGVVRGTEPSPPHTGEGAHEGRPYGGGRERGGVVGLWGLGLHFVCWVLGWRWKTLVGHCPCSYPCSLYRCPGVGGHLPPAILLRLTRQVRACRPHRPRAIAVLPRTLSTGRKPHMRLSSTGRGQAP